MAIRSGFFNSVNGDRKYDANRFAEYFASFIGNGVFPDPSDGLQVVPNDDMTVTVKAGKCWINGYIMINDDDYILEIDPADGVLNRIDRIVARYDVVDREIRLEVKKGQFSSNPVAQNLQRDADAYELGLADVYIAAGVVSVTQANITDLRFNTELCGIVKGTVDQIDTTDLFAQYQTAFNDWFQELKDVLDDNTAANLLNLINQLDDDLTTHLADGASHSKTARFVVGTSTAGWTAAECDYLCDGVDDQAEINAAIQALPATGGEIVILDGIYNITASINIPKDNVSIRGNGNATVLKRVWNSSSDEGVITLTSVEGCRVENLQIDGNMSTYTTSYNYGISLYSSSDNTVTSNTCNNSNYGIYLYSSSSDNTVTGNNCNNNNSRGIYLSSSSNNTVTGNNCNNNNSRGIYLYSSSNNTITSNTCNNNDNSGIYLYSSSSDNTVTGNNCNNNNSRGIYLYSSSNNTVTGNTCIRGTGTPEDYTTGQHTILLSGTSNNYNLIAMNNCMGKAVTDEGGTGNTLVYNKFDAT